MKRYLILLLACISCAAFGQNSQVRVNRRIYLWDVTRSMQGYNSNTKNYDPETNVWDKVVASLKNDIENISSESTDLIVLPFQVGLLECWQAKATSDGKNDLLEKIDSLKKLTMELTYTNLVGSLLETERKYIAPEYNNLIILLTDGKNSRDYGGDKAWWKMLSSWRDYAYENNAYLFYFMVTEAAQDSKVVEILENDPRAEILPPNATIPEFIDLYPRETVSFNIKEDIEKGISISIDNSQKVEVPGVMVSVKTPEGALIGVDYTVELTGNKIHFKLPYSFDDLKALMNYEEEIHIPLTLELLNKDEIQQKNNKRVFLTRNTVDLVLKNKIEKTLTVKIKQR